MERITVTLGERSYPITIAAGLFNDPASFAPLKSGDQVMLGTSMCTSTKFDKDEEGIKIDEKKYRGMIGSLLYLTASRPDITFDVCLCAHFQSCPKESHLIVVKRIFSIVKRNLELWSLVSKML